MNRNAFFFVMLGLLLAAVGWAVSRGQLPPADFTFVNGTEVQSIDPALVSGVPEGRVIGALFAGLYRLGPEKLTPLPELATGHELSDDRRTYTFRLREDAVWSDGSPITADDFVWSWMRFLHPETGSEYAYQLSSYVVGAADYNSAQVKVGDRVEVELADREPHPSGKKQLFPRGTMRRGVLREIKKPKEPQPAAGASEEEIQALQNNWRRQWVYVVEVDGQRESYSKATVDGATACEHVLPDFDLVAVKALDRHTLEVKLKNPTPYFLQLMAFYPLYPVNRECIEKYGVPDWTKPENQVVSGGYKVAFRRIRDRLRLVKNPRYWNAENVALEVVDVLAVQSATTALNMYMSDAVDWITDVPPVVIQDLEGRKDFIRAPLAATYFYRFNLNRKPLDDVRVRRALSMAINRRQIVERIARAGQIPARSLVPPMAGYQPAEGAGYDPEQAKQLLAEAGYPGGEGMPTIEILFNTQEAHATIAEKIMADWKAIGVDVELKNQEWGVYLDTVSELQYTVARAAWIGDYADPNTFLDMFVTDGENNQTGWSNAQYDEIVLNKAPREVDPEKRMQLLHEAEAILMQELPVAPIYFYVSKNMVRPGVRGFYPNIQDQHGLVFLSIETQDANGSSGNSAAAKESGGDR